MPLDLYSKLNGKVIKRAQYSVVVRSISVRRVFDSLLRMSLKIFIDFLSSQGRTLYAWPWLLLRFDIDGRWFTRGGCKLCFKVVRLFSKW